MAQPCLCCASWPGGAGGLQWGCPPCPASPQPAPSEVRREGGHGAVGGLGLESIPEKLGHSCFTGRQRRATGTERHRSKPCPPRAAERWCGGPAVSYQVLLCPTVSYCVLLCPAVPSHIQPCPAVSCSAQPCQPRTAGWCSPQGFNLCCTRGIKDLVA